MKEHLNELMKEQCMSQHNTSPCHNRGFFKGWSLGFTVAVKLLTDHRESFKDEEDFSKLLEELKTYSQSL